MDRNGIKLFSMNGFAIQNELSETGMCPHNMFVCLKIRERLNCQLKKLFRVQNIFSLIDPIKCSTHMTVTHYLCKNLFQRVLISLQLHEELLRYTENLQV